MSRPELVIPYCEDQEGCYIIQVTPNSGKTTVWLNQLETEQLFSNHKKSEKRRIQAHQRYIKKTTGKAPVSVSDLPPRVPLSAIVGPDDEIRELSSSDSDSSSDEETPEVTVTLKRHTPNTAKRSEHGAPELAYLRAAFIGKSSNSSSDEETPEVTISKPPTIPASKAKRSRAKAEAIYTLPKPTPKPKPKSQK